MADLKTPTTVTPEILTLCSMIPGSQPPPVHVPVRAVAGKFDHCVEIVDAVVQQHGGKPVNGWIIWQWPHTLVEAEFHSVWEKGSGELEDVSPKEDGEKRILFLPDPNRSFPKDAVVPSVRLALRKHDLIDEYIRLADDIQKVMVPGQTLGLDNPIHPKRVRLGTIIPDLQRMAAVRIKSQKEKRR